MLIVGVVDSDGVEIGDENEGGLFFGFECASVGVSLGKGGVQRFSA